MLTRNSSPLPGYSLFLVAAHEFGHALGLGHSSSQPSVMQPYYQGPAGDVTTYRLPADDRQAIQEVYGESDPDPDPDQDPDPNQDPDPDSDPNRDPGPGPDHNPDSDPNPNPSVGM